MAFGEIPRGLADLKVYAITGVSTLGSSVDAPGIRSLTFNIDSSTDELEGDNTIIAKAPGPKSLSGSIENGRINLAMIAVAYGGTVGTTGVTPNQVTAHDQTDDTTPRYFQVVGQAPDADSTGSAYRATLMKVLATAGLDETMEVNSWNTPSINIEGIAISGVLVKRQQYETQVAIT